MSKFYTYVAIRGNRILYRGYDGSKRIHRAEPFYPTVFVPAINKKTEWTTLEGKYVEPFKPGNIDETRKFIDDYKDVSGFEIYGNNDFVYQFIGEEYPNEVAYDYNQLRIAYLDIETECENGFPNIEQADQRINVITIRLHDQTYTFCLGKATPVDSNHHVYSYTKEDVMLEQFLQFWQDKDFDIVTGWNVQFFDIPYIVHRLMNVLDESAAKRLSPWGQLKTRVVTVKQQEHTVYEIVGISTMDYFDLYRKFTFVTRESYKLDHIAHVELGERKASFEGFDNIQAFYKGDFDKFVAYNHKDVQLVLRLEEKLRLLELALALAYSAKVNLRDVFSQVRTWDTIIYHYLNQHKIVIPQKEIEEKDTKFEGAYVKNPQVGEHKWIVSFDLDSLYPHLIMQYNISPDTKTAYGKRGSLNPQAIFDREDGKPITTFIDCVQLMNDVKHRNESLAANGVTFRRDKQGFLPNLMETMYEERKMYKKKMLECKAELKNLPKDAPAAKIKQLKNDISKYHNFQLVRKIQLNSAFGAIGNQYFRYYDLDLAEAITISGQLSIQYIERELNKFLNKTIGTKDVDFVIAADTDSVYLCLDRLVQKTIPTGDNKKIVKFLDKACKEILDPFIESKYNELASQMNAYAQKMHMKRESISNKGIWTAKKRYMLNVYMGEDNVLLDKPEMKIMGIETTRSSTPQIVREGLTKAIEIIMNGTEQDLRKYVEEFRENFSKQPPEIVAFPRGCNGLTEYADGSKIYRKSTPIHVRGSLLYNHYLKTHKLTKKYELIKDGEKIKYLYLKEPNSIGEDVISFINTLPKELDLHRFIDYTSQFEKSFVEPLKIILDTIRWKIKEESSLESLFV
jgi:DNA polymerase elongation subunit (family B)